MDIYVPHIILGNVLYFQEIVTYNATKKIIELWPSAVYHNLLYIKQAYLLVFFNVWMCQIWPA